MSRVLVIEPNALDRDLLSKMLTEQGLETMLVRGPKPAIDELSKSHYDLVIADSREPGTSWLKTLETIKRASPNIEVIVMLSAESVDSAVEALKLGATEVVTKPLNIGKVSMAVIRALEWQNLQSEVRHLRKALRQSFSARNILGASQGIREVLNQIPVMARSLSPVMITGETGTGKELVAKALHADSAIAHKPFVVVNCAALPEPLLESELFGHSRGAFTGAFTSRKGLVAEADGGTIFFDEITECSNPTQAKLLRFMDNGEFRPIGETKIAIAKVRILSATNRDPNEALKSGALREDLYYRLNMLQIHLPPLREREEDILLLAEHFLSAVQKERGKRALYFTPEARRALMNYSWPGNVRELRNVIERAVLMAKGPAIDQRTLSLPLTKVSSGLIGPSRESTLEDIERKHIQNVLEHCHGNKSQAARLLDISYTTLWRKLKAG